MWGIIGTWAMSYDGIQKAASNLNKNESAGDAIVEAIQDVEDNPYFKSVGYGGLPNEDGIVELDAAYMDGDSLDFGAVGGLRDFRSPVAIAKALSIYPANNFLVGSGASRFAKEMGFETREMFTDRANIHYKNRLKEMDTRLSPYSGHDTVGMVCLDSKGLMTAATSTSGLFMKKEGRLGDSCVIGSGLYVDSEVGGASATGLGEDLMKGCISYEIVRNMKEGLHPQLACEKAVFELEAQLLKRRVEVGDISVVAMGKDGEWGVASTIETFSFVVAKENSLPQVYTTQRKGNEMIHTLATKEWMDDYIEVRQRPLKEI